MKLYITDANFSSIELSRLLPEEIRCKRRTGFVGEGEKLHRRRFSIPYTSQQAEGSRVPLGVQA
jgi:hypothetical protein